MNTLRTISVPLHFLLLYALPFAACVHSALVAYHNRKRSSSAMFFFSGISMAGTGLIISNIAGDDFGSYLPGYVLGYACLIAVGHYFANREDIEAKEGCESCVRYSTGGVQGLDLSDDLTFNSILADTHQASLINRQTDPAYHFMADNIHHEQYRQLDPCYSWMPDNIHYPYSND